MGNFQLNREENDRDKNKKIKKNETNSYVDSLTVPETAIKVVVWKEKMDPDGTFDGIRNTDEEKSYFPGVTVTLYNVITGGGPIDVKTTDQKGEAKFIVNPGKYKLNFKVDIPDYTLTKQVLEVNNGSRPDPENGDTEFIIVDEGKVIDMYAGVREKVDGSISGTVFLDVDKDSKYNPTNDKTILDYNTNCRVDLYTVNNDRRVDSTYPNGNGVYNFSGVDTSKYYIKFFFSSEYINSFTNKDDSINGSKVNPSTGKTDIITINVDNKEIKNVNAGLIDKDRGSIEITVYLDYLKNGKLDEYEKQPQNLPKFCEILLYDSADNKLEVLRPVKDSNHTIKINLPVGVYKIKLELLTIPSYQFVNIIEGKLITDFNINHDNNEATSNQFELKKNQTDKVTILCSVSDEFKREIYTWLDLHYNGFLDEYDKRIPNVKLEDDSGGYICETDTNGYATICADVENLKLKDKKNYSPTKYCDKGGVIGNRCKNYGYGSREEIMVYGFPLNFGVVTDNMNDVGLRVKVYIDKDKDGVYDASETYKIDLDETLFSLYDYNDNLVGASLIGLNCYWFSNVKPGKYYIKFRGYEKYTINDKQTEQNNFNSKGKTEVFEYKGGDKVIYLALIKVNIAGYVFEDINENGIPNYEEYGVNGVQVEVYKSNNKLVKKVSTKTDETGKQGCYSISIASGSYYIKFLLPDGYKFTTNSSHDYNASKADPTTGKTDIFSIRESSSWNGYEFEKVNAGLVPITSGAIENFVFEDKDGSSIPEYLEPGLNNVDIELYNENGDIRRVGKTTNRVQFKPGYNAFLNLVIGKYYIIFKLLQGYKFTPKSNMPNGSCVNVQGKTDLFEVKENQVIDINAGMIKENSGSIQSFVWEDTNESGVPDESESGLNDINVSLYNQENVLIRKGRTRENELGKKGFVTFANLDFGKYYVVFDLPNGYRFTSKSSLPNGSSAGIDGKTELLDINKNEPVNVNSGMINEISSVMVTKVIDPVTESKHFVDSGDIITYTITATNKSSEIVNNVIIIDDLDENYLNFKEAYYIKNKDISTKTNVKNVEELRTGVNIGDLEAKKAVVLTIVAQVKTL